MTMPLDAVRIALVNAFLKKHGCAALLAWRVEEIVALFGRLPHWGLTFVLWPCEGSPIVYAPESEPDFRLPDPAQADTKRFGWGRLNCPEPFTNLAELVAHDAGRLGIQGKPVAWFSSLPAQAPSSSPGETPPLPGHVVPTLLSHIGEGWDASVYAAEFFAVKTPSEIIRIRRANAVASAALATFFVHLQPGLTEAELAGWVEFEIHRHTGRDGIGYARGFAAVQSGPNTAMAGRYNVSSGRKLASGDLVVIELATCVDGYWSDLTRTGCVGAPSADQQRLHTCVIEAQTAAIRAVRAGAVAHDVDAAARNSLTKAGWGSAFTHATGHATGFRYHDPGPVLGPGERGMLEAGVVVTTEPGIYDETLGGVRVEDDVWVTPDGAEMLSTAPRGLDGKDES